MSVKKYPVCERSSLQDGAVRTIKLFAKTIAVFELQGRIKAVDGLCRHMNMPIFQKGKLDGSVITCPFHGWQYDLQTLECIGKPDIYLREYETVIEHDKVYVSLTPPGGEIA